MIPVMIVPLLTRPELLYRMVASIDVDIEHLVIIDNGRCIPARGQAWETSGGRIEHLHILSMPSNLGVASSWNLGIKSTPFAPWWCIVNFDVTWPPGALTRLAAAARPDAVVLSAGDPPWCAFAVGDLVVGTVGLFDEAYHPGYVEDLDYERRVAHSGLHVIHTDIRVKHDNSSTLEAGYRGKNEATFSANHQHYQSKIDAGDFSAGHWSLQRRRAQTWD